MVFIVIQSYQSKTKAISQSHFQIKKISRLLNINMKNGMYMKVKKLMKDMEKFGFVV